MGNLHPKGYTLRLEKQPQRCSVDKGETLPVKEIFGARANKLAFGSPKSIGEQLPFQCSSKVFGSLRKSLRDQILPTSLRSNSSILDWAFQNAYKVIQRYGWRGTKNSTGTRRSIGQWRFSGRAAMKQPPSRN